MNVDRQQQKTEDRRNFLRSAGRLAVTPPAITLLLPTLTSDAAAASGLHGGSNSHGNGGSPNRQDDKYR